MAPLPLYPSKHAPFNKDKAMLVSILIGNYNYGRFIAESINSALTQTYSDIEVIVVDDGSTDESRSVIDGFGTRIRKIYGPNRGHAEVFNTGVEAAKGEIVCMLDSDDFFYPKKVERIVELYREHSEAMYVFHALNQIDPEGKVIRPEPADTQPKEIGSRRARYFHAPPTTGTTYKRELLQTFFPIPKPAYMGADNFTKFAAMSTAKGFYTPDVLGVIRLHGSNHGSMGMPLQKLLRHDTGIALAVHQRLPHLRSTERLMGIAFARYWMLRPRDPATNEMLDEYLAALNPVRRLRLYCYASMFYAKRRLTKVA